MSLRKIRVGVIGASKIAPPAIIEPAKAHPECEVVTIAARDPQRARTFAAEHGIPEVDESYADLLARDDIDLVFIGTVPSTHHALSLQAIAQGRATICEKPIAMNGDQTEDMVDAARKADVLLLEGYHHLHHPAFQRAVEIVRSGKIGAITGFNALFSAPLVGNEHKARFDLELGGGSLMDLGCYPLHWARTIFQAEPNILSAVAVEGTPGIDVRMSARLGFVGGVVATIHTGMDPDSPLDAQMTITGERGSVHMFNPIHPYMGHKITTTIGDEVTEEEVVGETTYRHQLDHAVDVIRGRAMPMTGGQDSIGNMRAIDAIYRAAGMQPRG